MTEGLKKILDRLSGIRLFAAIEKQNKAVCKLIESMKPLDDSVADVAEDQKDAHDR